MRLIAYGDKALSKLEWSLNNCLTNSHSMSILNAVQFLFYLYTCPVCILLKNLITIFSKLIRQCLPALYVSIKKTTLGHKYFLLYMICVIEWSHKLIKICFVYILILNNIFTVNSSYFFEAFHQVSRRRLSTTHVSRGIFF